MTASQIQTDSLLAARERWVARGVAAPAIVAVAADGAHVEGADGVRYLDFAGGIGCQNLGHNPEGSSRAIHEQVDRYLHQCFMVAAYEPYVDVCRKLGELSPCRGADQKSILFNSGAEAVENAVKIARAKTGRPAIVAFDRGFHGRTLMTMTLTSKVKPYKKGFGPFAPEVYRAPAPYPYRGITTDDSIEALEQLFVAHVDPATVAAVIIEPVQGEGGFIEMPADFPRACASCATATASCGSTTRSRPASAAPGRCGRSSTTTRSPTCSCPASRSAAGCRWRPSPGRRRSWTPSIPAGSAGRSAATRSPAPRPTSCSTRSPACARRARRSARSCAPRSRTSPRGDAIGEVRGLGPMLAIELVRDRESKTPAPERAAAVIAAARAQGLLLLGCGLHGNVIRLLPPLTIADEDLARGLEILEAGRASARPPDRRRVPPGRRDPAARPGSERALALRVDRAAASRRRVPTIRRARRSSCAGTATTARPTAPSSRSSDDSVLAWEPLEGIQPNLTPDEWHECDAALRREPQLIEALAKRGITDMDKVLIDVWGYRGFLVPDRYPAAGSAGPTPGFAPRTARTRTRTRSTGCTASST